MLATAACGACWSSCSPDFGQQGILDRFEQINPKFLIAGISYFYKDKAIDCLDKIAHVTEALPDLQHCICFDISGQSTTDRIKNIRNACDLTDFSNSSSAHTDIQFERLPFDAPLFIMFSSGTTGKPKCIVHGIGGTLLEHVKEHRLHLDLQPKEVLFYATTCGWMMWNWLISGLASSATLVLYDGFPMLNEGHKLLGMTDELSINVFGTSAGYLSALSKLPIKPKQEYKLHSLRMITSTGSTLAPETFDYVYQEIKRDLCLASISGGTDIIGCFALGASTLPVYRGQLQSRSLGYQVEVYNSGGQAIRQSKGELVCSAPFPSRPIYFWNDPGHKLYKQAYYERFPGVWCHGDFVELTAEEGLIFYGRSDAILNPGGVRIGTAEIYRQLEAFKDISGAVAVGQNYQSNERIILFIKMNDQLLLTNELKSSISKAILQGASPRHVPAKIIQVIDLPVTRSGKLSELAVKKVIHGQALDNTEALANPESLKYFENLPELSEP